MLDEVQDLLVHHASTRTGPVEPTLAARLSERPLAEEVPIAISYNGSSHAVLMASPYNLAELALGFTLSEGLAGSLREIEECSIVDHEDGFEVQLWLSGLASDRLSARRRHMVGPVGCGLCGLESLQEALVPPRRIDVGGTIARGAIAQALAAMEAGQVLNRRLRSLHAAALVRPGQGLVALREDVGRHNALDKLIGAVARDGEETGDCILVMTSRVSVDLVQKAACLGAPVMVAVSAPTELARRTAEKAGITLVAVARRDGFEAFTHPARLC